MKERENVKSNMKCQIFEKDGRKLKVDVSFENRSTLEYQVVIYETNKEYISDNYSRNKRITRIVENGIEEKVIEYTSVKIEDTTRIIDRGRQLYIDGKEVYNYSVKKCFEITPCKSFIS